MARLISSITILITLIASFSTKVLAQGNCWMDRQTAFGCQAAALQATSIETPANGEDYDDVELYDYDIHQSPDHKLITIKLQDEVLHVPARLFDSLVKRVDILVSPKANRAKCGPETMYYPHCP